MTFTDNDEMFEIHFDGLFVLLVSNSFSCFIRSSLYYGDIIENEDDKDESYSQAMQSILAVIEAFESARQKMKNVIRQLNIDKENFDSSNWST